MPAVVAVVERGFPATARPVAEATVAAVVPPTAAVRLVRQRSLAGAAPPVVRAPALVLDHPVPLEGATADGPAAVPDVEAARARALAALPHRSVLAPEHVVVE